MVNGYSNVPPQTREKVERAIKEYGYIPNSSARNLAGMSNNTVGLFFVEYDSLNALNENIIHSSPFYSEFLVDTIDKLKKQGFQLIVSIVNDVKDFDNVLTMCANRTISGCIFMGDMVGNNILQQFYEQNCTVFLVNQRSHPYFENDYLLNTENYEGAYQAVKLLVDHGHKKIAHITGSLEKTSIKERFEGYRDCLLHNGLRLEQQYIRFTHIHRAESGYSAMTEILEENADRLPTAVFTANDLLAFGALRALREHNLKVPEDVSVIGYDNAEQSQYSSPPLTTVATSIDKLTELTVNNLLSVIRGNKDVPHCLKMSEYSIVERKSVAKCKDL